MFLPNKQEEKKNQPHSDSVFTSLSNSGVHNNCQTNNCNHLYTVVPVRKSASWR